MKKPVCASCEKFDTKVVKSKEQLKPSWLSKVDYVKKFINSHEHRLSYPDKYDSVIRIKLNNKYQGRKILYWGANEKSHNTPLVKGAKQAYGNFENSGVASINSKGIAVVKLMCPQVYRTGHTSSEKTTFFRHMHYVIENAKGNWGNQIYTKILNCDYSIDKLISERNSGYTVILNTLPCELYGKDHILGSYNLPYNNIKSMTKKELVSWIVDVTEIHYPKLYKKYIKTKKINPSEIHIITYCQNKDCKASTIAIKNLVEKGFVNVNEYNGGMEEYRKKFKHDL